MQNATFDNACLHIAARGAPELIMGLGYKLSVDHLLGINCNYSATFILRFEVLGLNHLS